MPTPAAPNTPSRSTSVLGLAGLASLAMGLALGGCASRPPASSEPGPRPTAQAPVPPPAASAPSRSPLEIERRWLQQWFDGTPVVIALPQREALAVDVPREFCFDTGRAEVKPALKAVLDKVAQSMRRVPSARLNVVAVPADPGGDAALARQRAVKVREHLRSRGVAEERLAPVRVAFAGAVQLRLQTPGPVAAWHEDNVLVGD